MLQSIHFFFAQKKPQRSDVVFWGLGSAKVCYIVERVSNHYLTKLKLT